MFAHVGACEATIYRWLARGRPILMMMQVAPPPNCQPQPPTPVTPHTPPKLHLPAGRAPGRAAPRAPARPRARPTRTGRARWSRKPTRGQPLRTPTSAHTATGRWWGGSGGGEPGSGGWWHHQEGRGGGRVGWSSLTLAQARGMRGRQAQHPYRQRCSRQPSAAPHPCVGRGGHAPVSTTECASPAATATAGSGRSMLRGTCAHRAAAAAAHGNREQPAAAATCPHVGHTHAGAAPGRCQAGGG